MKLHILFVFISMIASIEAVEAMRVYVVCIFELVAGEVGRVLRLELQECVCERSVGLSIEGLFHTRSHTMDLRRNT